MNTIPEIDEETHLEFPLNRTKMGTEYTLKYWVTKPEFYEVDGDYCSYIKNKVCIAYKIPFPSKHSIHLFHFFDAPTNWNFDRFYSSHLQSGAPS